jgi:Fe-S cluster assembly scaffold protein SufB
VKEKIKNLQQIKLDEILCMLDDEIREDEDLWDMLKTDLKNLCSNLDKETKDKFKDEVVEHFIRVIIANAGIINSDLKQKLKDLRKIFD